MATEMVLPISHPNRVRPGGIGWEPRRSQTVTGQSFVFSPDEPSDHAREFGMTSCRGQNSRHTRPDWPYKAILRGIDFLAGATATI